MTLTHYPTCTTGRHDTTIGFVINIVYVMCTSYDYIFVLVHTGDGLHGDRVCYGMYYVAIVMYLCHHLPRDHMRTTTLSMSTRANTHASCHQYPDRRHKLIALNMLWLLTELVMTAFVNEFYESSDAPRHQRDGLGTAFMAPMPRNRCAA